MRVALIGATGRMGQEIARCVRDEDEFADVTIACGLVSPKTATEKVAALTTAETVPLLSDPALVDMPVDVIVDFSNRSGTAVAIGLAKRLKAPALIGTTGLEAEDEEAISGLSEIVPVVRATNTSVVVTAMLDLVADAARLLGSSFDIEVIETHHRGKKDAPSGTASSLLDSLARARETEAKRATRFGRAGMNAPRVHGELGVHSVRGGDVVGEHTVCFLGAGERLEITQRATSRAVFARGALVAARFLDGRRGSTGLFTMREVLRGT